MMVLFELELHILPGAPGWATCSVRAGDQTLEIASFSHALTDGIDDLARATVSIVCGSWGPESFSMDYEPEPRWQWRLKREMRRDVLAHRAILDVTITRFDDVVAMTGEEVFRATCDPDQFGGAVLSALRRMMTREASHELIKRWSHFPLRAIAALEAALTTPIHPERRS